jgi:hypothetical protein
MGHKTNARDVNEIAQRFQKLTGDAAEVRREGAWWTFRAKHIHIEGYGAGTIYNLIEAVCQGYIKARLT